MGEAIMWPLLFIEFDLFSFFIEEPDFMCSLFIDELFIACIDAVGLGEAAPIWSAIAVPEAARNAAASIRDVKRIRVYPPLRWEAIPLVRHRAIGG